MCGIAGFSHRDYNYKQEQSRWSHVLSNMNDVQKHRGPDGDGIFLTNRCGLSHVRLAVIDILTGDQPMIRTVDGHNYTIVHNGEIYNMNELKESLKAQGDSFETTSDTEVILAGYIRYGIDFVKQLNGVFSFAIWDGANQKLLLFRDRLGVKPLFYTTLNDAIVFSSEIKGLFEYPGFSPIINRESLCEIFALGPAKSYGKGVFQDVLEVLPGHVVQYDVNGLKQHAYWNLQSKPHQDSLPETIANTSYLIKDAVTKQMLSDIPICTFLSGGVDSSLVTSICAKELEKQGSALNTFSFDFIGNEDYFKPNNFQPSQDRPWVDQMVAYAKTNHHYLYCGNQDLIDFLYQTVDARDLPCMADVESSLMYFCKQVIPYNKVTLTGECADEIFGGYPWFHSKEAFNTHAFPWTKTMEPRKMLLRDDIIEQLDLDSYAQSAYEKSIQETPLLDGESGEEKRRREIAYLNIKWFMVTLLDRMDRTSMYHGLEARVPLADHRILEYVWNIPWEYKCNNNLVKGLLRSAGEDYLPHDVLYRKKSPYPKTYHPEYEKTLGNMLSEVLANPNAPIHTLVDPKKVNQFLKSPSDYGEPWYGQLMAGPQLLAFLLQVNYWLEKYN